MASHLIQSVLIRLCKNRGHNHDDVENVNFRDTDFLPLGDSDKDLNSRKQNMQFKVSATIYEVEQTLCVIMQINYIRLELSRIYGTTSGVM